MTKISCYCIFLLLFTSRVQNYKEKGEYSLIRVGPKVYGFLAVLFINGASILAILFLNRMCSYAFLSNNGYCFLDEAVKESRPCL